MSPTFGKVLDIIHAPEGNTFLFHVEVYESCYFCDHYNSFVVKSTACTQVVDIHSLADYHAFLVRKSFDTSDHNMYIVLPYTY